MTSDGKKGLAREKFIYINDNCSTAVSIIVKTADVIIIHKHYRGSWFRTCTAGCSLSHLAS